MRYLKLNDEQLFVLDEEKSEIELKQSQHGLILVIENAYNFLIPHENINRFLLDVDSNKFILDINEYIKK